jgi:hypothetical protein
MDGITRNVNLLRHHTHALVVQPVTRLPGYLRLAFLLGGAMTLLVLGWTLVLSLNEQPINPLTSYTSILPGQPRTAMIAKIFSCGFETGSEGRIEYCTRSPATGPFLFIAVTFSSNVVSSVDFVARNGALTVGQVAADWGRPQVLVYGQFVLLSWPHVGVTVNGQTQSRRFSYFNPVVRLSIISPQISAYDTGY